MEKAKKRKIIIAIVCATILIVGAIVTTILLTKKRFDLTPNDIVSYNNHTSIISATPESHLSIVEKTNDSTPKYYSNACVKVYNNNNSCYGVYSYIDDKMIIPTNYALDGIKEIAITNSNNENTGKYIFRVGTPKGETNKSFEYYSDKGEKLSVCSFDNNTKKVFGQIKQRKMSINDSRKGIKVKTKNKFETVKIELENIEYISSFIKECSYNYELWQLTDKDGNVYKNLYEVNGSDRELVQTINNPIGNNAETINLEVHILNDGTPRLISSNTYVNSQEELVLKTTVYDINFKEKGSSEIKMNIDQMKFFKVGDLQFIQYKIPTNQDDYDYAETIETTDGDKTNYYNIETYTLNMKNGKMDKEKFNYVITDYNDRFNSKTTLIKACKIDDEKLENEQIFLINSKLKLKEITYEIDNITRINDDRYLVENDNGYYLIDDNYDEVCFLGKYNSYFTTDNSIIVSQTSETNIADNYSYVCTLNGVIVKKYSNSEIINVYNEDYYMVKTKTTIDNEIYNNYYLENLGIRQETPIFSKKSGASTYTYNDIVYVAYYDSLLSDGVSIITRVKAEDSKFTYEFYNIEGKLLHTIKNVNTSTQIPTYWNYTDENHVIIYFATHVGGTGYTLVVDR